MSSKYMTRDEILQALRVPLPPEAIKPHPTKTYLSQINAIYVVDRLNDVFGLGGWMIENEIIEKQDAGIRMVMRKGNKQEEFRETMVVVKARFTAKLPPQYDENGKPDNDAPELICIESFGGNDNDDLGDAYKGACTDALTKIGSYLGIGADVWKDKKKQPASSQPAAKQQPSKPTNQASAPAATPPPKAPTVLDPTGPTWHKTVINMARAINQQGGVFEDLLEILKTKYNTVVTPGDVAMLKADVDKAASNPTNNP